MAAGLALAVAGSALVYKNVKINFFKTGFVLALLDKPVFMR